MIITTTDKPGRRHSDLNAGRMLLNIAFIPPTRASAGSATHDYWTITTPSTPDTYFPNGEPLAAAVVQAYRWRYTPFGRRMKIVKTALTDDSGEYRLFRLTFGEYIVSASYSHRSQRSALNGRQVSANVPDPDEGYTT